MDIDLQLSPAVVTWSELRHGVAIAEEAGFHTFWVFDHFLGAMISGGRTMLEPFTLLGALASATSTIRLGSLVLNIVNRSAAVIASGAASVQTISGGRFMLGLGAGASPASKWAREHRLLQIPIAPSLAERHGRLLATLDEIEMLWSPSRGSELETFPLPTPRPPIILGVNGVGLAAIAGRRCDGMNVRSNHPDLERLFEAAAVARGQREDTPDSAWDGSVWAWWDEALLDAEHPQRRRWEQLGISRLVLVWFDRFDAAALERAAPFTR
jgi:alkanesulfonate monooxygenase SsuD/methylene tetrahydromethanopterin reductase-like flavin-dependent oxidoreductase (luciferase family)